ncbi:MAG: CoB--CoM heterodisulfide reductase subunit C [Methanosarcinaceae archaeon]|nr:CoB--CoM heterodisulfide reductase subunit C [Methanosarcinaceae archaeon]
MTEPINSSEIDKTFFEKLKEEKGMEKVLLCFNCSGCSTGCPMAEIESNFNIKKYIRMAGLGLKDRLLNDKYIWYCTTCYKCQERCPEEVLNVDTLLKIRTMAVAEGIMYDDHRAVAANVIETGHGVPINDKNKENRKKLGLKEIPPTVHSFPEAYEDVKKLLKSVGFDELVSK